MKLKDLMSKKDPVYDLFSSMGEDEERRKKKKKKKKKEKKLKKAQRYDSGRSRFDTRVGGPSREDLLAMGKKELRDYIVEKNIRVSAMDLTSKSAMRQAILDHLGQYRADRYDGGDPSSGPVVISPNQPTVALQQTAAARPSVMDEEPPYYYDEDTGRFVIPKAQDTDALTCYDAMSALGEVRRRKNPADDFTHLMDTLTSRIIEEAKKPALSATVSPVIEAEFEVIDEGKGS